MFYRPADQRIMVVTYAATGDVFVGDTPRAWTETRLAASLNPANQNFDIAPDGSRIVALMPPGASDNQSAQNRVIFLQNFSDEMRRRVGTAR